MPPEVLTKEEQGRIRKILVVQFRPWGDVLLATAYLGAVRRHFPRAQIHFLVSAPYDEVLYGNPYIDTVLVSAQRGGIGYVWGRFRILVRVMLGRYDLVIDQQNHVGSRTVLMVSMARHRLGWQNGKSRALYTLRAPESLPALYAASRNMHMVEPLGIPAEGFELFFYVKEESRRTVASWLERHGAGTRRLIAFAPGSKYVRKAWDARLFAATADWLRVNYPDFEIVVLRAPGEADAALRMIDAMERRKALLAPETSFNEAAAFVERSALLVCNDGGLNHLSVALGTPALAVFGSAAWSMWSAQGAAPYHYHVAPDKPYPAGDRSFGISAERVCDKLRAIMPEIARFTRTTAPGPAGPTPAMES